MELETVACDLCGSKDARHHTCLRDRIYGIPGEFQLVQCQSCGLLYLNPRPDKASIGACYPDLDYHAFKSSAGLKSTLMKWLHHREARALLAGLPRGAGGRGKRCGNGGLAAGVRALGAGVTG